MRSDNQLKPFKVEKDFNSMTYVDSGVGPIDSFSSFTVRVTSTQEVRRLMVNYLLTNVLLKKTVS